MPSPLVPVPFSDVDVEVRELSFLLLHEVPVGVGFDNVHLKCQKHRDQAEAKSEKHRKNSSHDSRFPAEVGEDQRDYHPQILVETGLKRQYRLASGRRLTREPRMCLLVH